MSIENAKQFLTDLVVDEALGSKADDALVDALYAIAREIGREFSEYDLRAAMDDSAMTGTANDLENLSDLSDHEMDQVVAAGRSSGSQAFPAAIGGLDLAGKADTVTGLGISGATVFGGVNGLTALGGKFSSFSKSGFSR